jgi:hypothetical protein
MEMHPTLTEEERNVPLWPWEEQVISGAEYQRSLKGLKHFVEEVDVNQLQTLEDLSAVASLVGHDVYVVAVTKGTKSEKKTAHFEPTVSEPISSIEREYVFTHRISNQEIVVTASKGHSLISRYRLCGFHRYLSEELRVRLPSDRDIAIGEKPNVDEQSIYAKDLRGLGRAYHPAKEPDSPEIQQVFAHLLKDALSTLRDVISALA